MTRHLFYDDRTGEIVHVHEEIDGPRDRRAADIDVDLAQAIVGRQHDLEHIEVLASRAAPRSSRESLRRVDAASGRLRTRRTPAGFWAEHAAIRKEA